MRERERERLTSSLGSTGSPEASSRVISSRLPSLAAVWMGRVGPVREEEGELMTRGCCCSAHTATHTTNTHHAAGTSRLNERLRARGEARETEIERASGGEKKKIGLMAGRGGESGLVSLGCWRPVGTSDERDEL
jgi:hypothetical protein